MEYESRPKACGAGLGKKWAGGYYRSLLSIIRENAPKFYSCDSRDAAVAITLKPDDE